MSAEKVELKTERLLLRPFRLEDVDDVFDYASDPEWARYSLLPQPYLRRDAEEFVARQVLASWETRAHFAIVLKGKVIGGVNLIIDAPNQSASLGYGITRVYWGRGYAIESARCAVSWGFETYGLVKVWATTDLRNERSLRVMEKLGMTREGVLRSHRLVRGERRDEVYYGLLREEWKRPREAEAACALR